MRRRTILSSAVLLVAFASLSFGECRNGVCATRAPVRHAVRGTVARVVAIPGRVFNRVRHARQLRLSRYEAPAYARHSTGSTGGYSVPVEAEYSSYGSTGGYSTGGYSTSATYGSHGG